MLSPDIQLAINEAVSEAIKEERNRADAAYAIKLAERVVFGVVAILAVASIPKLIPLIFAQFK